MKEKKKIKTRSASNIASKEPNPEDEIDDQSINTSHNLNPKNPIDPSCELVRLTINMNSRFDEIATMLAKNYNELVSKINKNEERTLKNEDQILANQETLKNIQNQIDEQTDRSLRCTLIFKNVPYGQNENKQECTNVLTSAITKHCPDLTKSFVEDSIERCHRGSSNNANSPAHIFVKFLDWKKSQIISKAVIEKNKKNKSNALNFAQMFSKGTTVRRNKALEHRALLMKEYKDSYFVISYPAKILEKKPNANNFVVVKEF